MNLEVSEVFRSLQGEGPSCGRPATFLRLRRCNLACGFCDTRYTWDQNDPGYQEYRVLSVEDLGEELLTNSPRLIVVTGGEPLLWRGHLGDLFDLIPSRTRIEIETAGTINPLFLKDFGNVHFNVSPKLENSENAGRRTIRPEVINVFARHHKTSFKFVVKNEHDISLVKTFVEFYTIPAHRVWLMPMGVTKGEVLQNFGGLFSLASELGFNLTQRLHVLAFGALKGV